MPGILETVEVMIVTGERRIIIVKSLKGVLRRLEMVGRLGDMSLAWIGRVPNDTVGDRKSVECGGISGRKAEKEPPYYVYSKEAQWEFINPFAGTFLKVNEVLFLMIILSSSW